MKCDTCKHNYFHPSGSFYAVAEGGDDPYSYQYCSKGHWGGDNMTEESENDVSIDPWANCNDYKVQELPINPQD